MDIFKDKVKLICPLTGDLAKVVAAQPLEPFEKITLQFINIVSETILKDHSLRKYPELIALAYWMRSAHIKQLQEQFINSNADYIQVPRGLAFHIAPANVDTIFVYSWFISLLVGNTNIVRLSSKTSDQLETLLAILNNILAQEQFEQLRNTTALLRYGHDTEVTEFFSKQCDLRIIWGGDATIKSIRALELNPTALEVVFPDRFSYAVIDAQQWLAHTNKEETIAYFYNDAFWFDQNACSSPRLVVWCGAEKDITPARNIFWQLLEEYITTKNVPVQPAVAVQKLTAEVQTIFNAKSQVTVEQSASNAINRVFIESFEDISRDAHCGGGLFYETTISELAELGNFLKTKDQTLSAFGITKEQLSTFIKENKPRGICRVVPFGQALTFSNYWDGLDLLATFARKVELVV